MPLLSAAMYLPRNGAWTCLALSLASLTFLAAVGESVTTYLVGDLYVGSCMIIAVVALVRGQEAQRHVANGLRRQALSDPLTGLVNRRVLDSALRSALADATSADPGNALILIDLDNFKQINDVYGHPAGDDALKHLADLLKANTRRDTIISRIGGDEFAVLLPGCIDADALRRAQQIVQAVRSTPLDLEDGRRVMLTISAGVAHERPETGSPTDLYGAADAGLYNAKRAGRDTVGTPA
jgi:diguanylate cyclase (GGDEF)-like protein